MKLSRFKPNQVLFSPTTKCNLKCQHCDITQIEKPLSKKAAVRFLSACHKTGIEWLGFTGGEPFYAQDFLCAVSKKAVGLQMFFDRIITNACWFKSKKELLSVLKKLLECGYDGRFFVSIDAFHTQNLQKAALFIRAASEIWDRPDMVSIVCVKGAREKESLNRLKKLAALLNTKFSGFLTQRAVMKSKELLIRVVFINLTPVGRAEKLRNPWDGKWFKDDFCQGPGNVFFVLADGKVKPCCGYSQGTDLLTIGSIYRHSPGQLLENAQKNLFVSTIFELGFHPIRKQLESFGVRFPGKTTNHCFFCHYLSHHILRKELERSLKVLNKNRKVRGKKKV